MTGNYNTGKSFWTSKFLEKPIEDGHAQITAGICCSYDKVNKIIYIDSEGFERAICKKSINKISKDKRDFLLRERCIKETIS